MANVESVIIPNAAAPAEKRAKVELRNVKHAEFASQETNCFTATVYIDGKKAGTVENDGHGGSDNYSPYSLFEQLKAITDTMPPITACGTELSMDPDIFIGDLLEVILDERWKKRRCSKKTLFRLTTDTDEASWRTISAKFSPQVKAFLQKKYGETLGRILNEEIG